MAERILDMIDSPKDIKKLSIDQLQVVASEIRDDIVRVVSLNGGHLAPSMGTVELTLALHRVFDSPKDKIIWDVGHQSYAHKIVTGRRKEFKSLRTFGGISGFPRRSESEHDCFGTGHASTSIAAALGMASARDIRGEDFDVVAVIGDGSLTGGMAYEALNQAGHLRKNMIVVLNDNKMSIAENVGAMSTYLNKLISTTTYARVESDVWALLGMIPKVGERAQELASRMEESLKNLIVPGTLFEELGFKYFGPLDGHDIPELIRTFQQVRKLSGPVLVHLATVKGKGYAPAEQDASKFHGIGSFDKATGSLKEAPKRKTYTQVFGDALVEMAEKDEEIVAITAAMPAGTGLAKFALRFPERFFDVGIAEQLAVTFGAGLSTQGLKPVVAIYSTFLQRAFDQVMHDVCLQNLPVRFFLDRAGLVGDDGPTHHGAFDLTYLCTLPNIVVMTPKDEAELRDMLRTALEYEEGPIAVRYPRRAGIGVECGEPVTIDIGSWERLRPGADVEIVAAGSMVYPSLDASDMLEKAGIDAGVVNARFIKPFDESFCMQIASANTPVITVEENSRRGGFGESFCQQIRSLGHSAPAEVIGLPDRFVSHGQPNELLDDVRLTNTCIAEAAKALLTRKVLRSETRV
jgi:1-deoxy-D-xylulose-5-phosphate synthase